MKKAVWLTGVFVIVFVLVVGCYLLFFREKNSKVPEGTFVRMEMPERNYAINGTDKNAHIRTEGMWDAWQRNA